MKEFDVDSRKAEIFKALDQLEKEANVLLGRIKTTREDLESVHTYEEAKEFDRTHDLEEGFDIITLV